MKHDRNMKWRTMNGIMKIKDLEDTHLVNIIHLLVNSRIPSLKKKRKENKKSNPDLAEYLDELLFEQKNILKNFKKEMKYRKLPESMLDDAPYPFKDKDGLVKKWDYETREAVVVSNAKRFITGEDEC